MPSVTFLGGPMTAEVCCEYQPDGQTTILDLARLSDLPIYWHCGLGTCGTCAARISVVAGQPCLPGNKERNVLTRAGKPPEASGAGWRLTCGYRLSGETLRVEW